MRSTRFGQRADNFLEAVPLRCRPNLGLNVAECPNESGNPRRRFDVVSDKDIEIVARSQHGVAAEPLNIWHSSRTRFMASRSSCSSPLGERTASAFSRVSMMKVGMAPPPLCDGETNETLNGRIDFNQIAKDARCTRRCVIASGEPPVSG